MIITTETITNHVSKRDLLKTKGCLFEKQIYETINYVYANNIYQKLKEKNWLGRLLNYCDSEKDIPKYARQVNDIIEVLYNTSYGRGFERYYEDLLSLKENEVYLKYLYALCTLEILGVESIPLRIIPGLLPRYKNKFNFNEFLNCYADILIVYRHRVKVRCLRLIQKVVKSDLKKEDYFELLQQVVLQTVGQFHEGDVNEWTELFQKVLLVKRLKGEKVLDISDILMFLQRIEKDCEEYSYYWIQRGIAEQQVNNYENADNYFRKATKINPNSYQARHALAKNLMERGIDEYNKGSMSYAPYYFTEGQDEMKKLLEADSFSRAFRYSIHAYIDMEIKYLDISKQVMGIDEVIFIQDNILHINSNELDNYLATIIETFILYCKSNHIEDYCREIMSINWSKETKINVDKDAYEIDNFESV